MKPYSSESQPELTAYLTGFILALLLTLMAFGLVGTGAGESPRWLTVTGVSILAVLQILVHLRYFLHLNLRSSQYLNVQVILFALFIIFIMVGGTLWIMQALNYQMLPVKP
ncbi:MAG: cytochrome o ubiquinol oxidase subunit IV [Gammaproteobacteria bacterium]